LNRSGKTAPSANGLFTVSDRDHVRDRVLEMADTDKRVVAGAMVGSLALGGGDRWSDLDLTFAVADDHSMYDVLEDWTRQLVAEFDAAQLFDLPSGPSIYRVFLLPGCLQFDLSFTPASKFGAVGSKFKLLFGSSVERPNPLQPSAHELFGYAVHHALRARFCIERGRYWHAEYWISATRDYALSLACHRRGLPAQHGRGFDDLPAEVHDVFRNSLVASLDRSELFRAFGVVIEGLLTETEEVKELATKVMPQLRQLAVE
jgi:hypothetical protein